MNLTFLFLLNLMQNKSNNFLEYQENISKN